MNERDSDPRLPPNPRLQESGRKGGKAMQDKYAGTPELAYIRQKNKEAVARAYRKYGKLGGKPKTKEELSLMNQKRSRWIAKGRAMETNKNTNTYEPDDLDYPKLTPKEAGERGGKALIEKYGPERMKELGKKGGTATVEKYGLEFYRELGRKAAQRRKEMLEEGL